MAEIVFFAFPARLFSLNCMMISFHSKRFFATPSVTGNAPFPANVRGAYVLPARSRVYGARAWFFQYAMCHT